MNISRSDYKYIDNLTEDIKRTAMNLSYEADENHVRNVNICLQELEKQVADLKKYIESLNKKKWKKT